MTHDTSNFSATYSPEDDKLRLYAAVRLDTETYARAKACGFRWAPRQELFYTVWSPAAEDFALELAGDIGDEDKSLAERAEERAERFEGYQASRKREATAAQQQADKIGERFYMGQPILVGHHSERGARKDQQRMHNAMSRAVSAWDTAAYWNSRAAGALAHARHKEDPAVRHRRIKKLDSELRKIESQKRDEAAMLARWTALDTTAADAHDRALDLANNSAYSFSRRYPLADFPRETSTYEGERGLWSALDGGVIDAERARATVLDSLNRATPRRDRWAAHLQNRIAYERAMLDESGGVPAAAFKLEVGGQVTAYGEWLTIKRINRSRGRISSVTTTAPAKFSWMQTATVSYEQITEYRAPTPELVAAAKAPPMLNMRSADAVEMTAAKYRDLYAGYKGTRTAEATAERGAYRYRVTVSGGKLLPVFITDAKEHKAAPAPGGAVLPRGEAVTPKPRAKPAAPASTSPEAEAIERMRDTMSAGGLPVVTVAAVDYFPTPADVAARVVALAGPMDGDRILEPSAGDGALIRALREHGATGHVVAVEQNATLSGLLHRYEQHEIPAPGVEVVTGDFLGFDPAQSLGRFDLVLMNPPFSGGADVRHIRHALRFLKPGGRLVAICADGPRQRDALQDDAEHWESLPAGSFKQSGTMVNTALCVMRAP